MDSFIRTIISPIVLVAFSFANQPIYGEDPFTLSQIHSVDLTISADDYKAMDPPAVTPFGNRPTAANSNRPVPGSPEFGAGKFGFEFKYVSAEAKIDGKSFPKIGIRYKGNGTYLMSTRQTKRSLKIDLDRFDSNQKWLGIKKLNLNSGVMDPTKSREALAYSVFRAAGVPAPRTGFGEVVLNVPGKFHQEYLGVFTLVEQVDKSFLQEHFKSSKGLLLKPEGIRGLPHLGSDAQAYHESYNAKSDGTAAEWQRLVTLTRLINQAADVEFSEQIQNYLDVDEFAKFLAANTVLASLDGFIGLGHNYYLYLDPATNKFVFIPWDLDLSFGTFSIYGTTQQLAQLSIDHPHVGENKLIDRLLAMPTWKATYRSHVQHVVSSVFTAQQLGQQVIGLEELLKPFSTKEKAAAEARKEGLGTGGFPGTGMFGASPVPLTEFIAMRSTSIQSQLDGKSKGYIPTQSFGFGPANGFGPGNQLAKPFLEALDSNKDGQLTDAEATAGITRLMREWDKDSSGAVDQRELADGLQKLVPPPGIGNRPPKP